MAQVADQLQNVRPQQFPCYSNASQGDVERFHRTFQSQIRMDCSCMSGQRLLPKLVTFWSEGIWLGRDVIIDDHFVGMEDGH
eukprot:4630557-Lingulodinium_polyedra.AAC.1